MLKERKDYNKNKLLNHFIQKNQNKKPIEITEMKNFPTYFFVCFIIVCSVLIFRFVPNFYQIADKHYKYSEFIDKKFNLKYFSEFISELDIISKVILNYLKQTIFR
jgi:hypothetical protein